MLYSRISTADFIFLLQEIVSDPHLFVGGASRFDVKQGELGMFKEDRNF